MRPAMKWIQGVLFVGQLAFLVITPPLALIWLGIRLQNKFGWGEWVILVAIAVGFISAGCSVYNLFKKTLLTKREKKDRPIGYNRHI